jgi:phosphodiesterase/alkaline phosphatase D-like protein
MMSTVFRYLVEEKSGRVLFLGEYIYEYDMRSTDLVRKRSEGVEADTLVRYGKCCTQYQLDSDLQRCTRTPPL